MKQAISTYWESIMRWVYYQRSDSAAVCGLKLLVYAIFQMTAICW